MVTNLTDQDKEITREAQNTKDTQEDLKFIAIRKGGREYQSKTGGKEGWENFNPISPPNNELHELLTA